MDTITGTGGVPVQRDGSAARSRTLPAASPSVLRRPTVEIVTLTALTFLGACVAVIAVALANQPYFDFLNGFVRTTETVPRGLLFSSFLVLLGGAIVLTNPARFGFTRGDIAREWRLVVGLAVVAAVVTWIVLRLTGSTPYSDASLFIEAVDVPFTEELLFRGVLLTLLLAVLARWHSGTRLVVLAVVFDAVAFGLGHGANALSYPVAFVASQVIFACLIGLACAFAMVRTRSVYPAMLLHAVVNAGVVLGS